MGTKLASVGITDGTGAVLVNENLSVYAMIRVVGKKTDSLTLTCAHIIGCYELPRFFTTSRLHHETFDGDL